jgi:hypothetical protein
VRAWWIANGRVHLAGRYGAWIGEPAKGKNAVELAAEKDLAPASGAINAAVEVGELDYVIF